MALCFLDFLFEERPKWRRSEQPSTSEMVTEIVEFRKKYEQLPEYAKQFCTGSFSSIMAAECINHSYVGETPGSQTIKGTLELLELFSNSRASCGEDEPDHTEKQALERRNTYTAMKKVYGEILKGNESLTVEKICEVHGILMKGLIPEAGKIRSTEVYTIWEGSKYTYTPPYEVEDKFFEVVCRHRIYIKKLSSIEKNSQEEVDHVFKCAARLLFDFVDTHPFLDGNGRMCRLLASYVLNLITPFPVSLYRTNSYDQKRSGRTDYVNAIVQCRDNREEGPRELAAMLVEGAWNGWKRFFSYDHNKLGSFVVQASKLDEIAENVRRILKSRNSELNVEEVTKRIVEEVKGMDVEMLGDSSHFETSVRVAPPRYISLEVFK